MRILSFIFIYLVIAVAANSQNTFYYNVYERWTPELERLANDYKDVRAIVSLGSCYDRASGVERDRQKAFELFKIAADKGDFLGKYNLAHYYAKGFCSNKDYKKAVDLFEEVIKINPQMSVVYSQIANLYEQGGNGLDQDYQKAFKYYLIDANNGNKVSQFRIGDFYKKGIGVPTDLGKAKEYFLKSANQGFPLSMYEVATYYKNEEDYAEAAKWYKASSAKNFGISTMELAHLYYDGKGVEQSYSKAYELYELAVKQNNKLAGFCNFLMSKMLAEGKGLPKDPNKAMKYLKESADNGFARAQYMIGDNYYNGTNEEKNYSEAVKYFEKALNNESVPESIKGSLYKKLSTCYRFGRGVEQDIAKADELMQQAAEYGDADAQKIKEWLNIEK